MLIALAAVAFCYCGSKYCPKVLSSNKELFLGVLVGMALFSFSGLKLEGLEVSDGDRYRCGMLEGDPCGRLLAKACFVEGTETRNRDQRSQGCDPKYDPGPRSTFIIPTITPQNDGR